MDSQRVTLLYRKRRVTGVAKLLAQYCSTAAGNARVKDMDIRHPGIMTGRMTSVHSVHTTLSSTFHVRTCPPRCCAFAHGSYGLFSPTCIGLAVKTFPLHSPKPTRKPSPWQ